MTMFEFMQNAFFLLCGIACIAVAVLIVYCVSLSCKSGYAKLRVSARYTFLVAMGRSNRKGGITDGRRDFNRPFRN